MGLNMNYLIKTVQPTTEPVSLAEAQLHLRLDTEGSPPSHPDDTLVQSLISTARESVEQYTGVTVGSASYEMQSFVDKDNIKLQTFPVNSIESVTYVDEDDVMQTIEPSNYSINNFFRPARIYFKGTAARFELTVRFTAGYTDGQSPNTFPTPAGVKAAMLLLIGHLYENRESVNVGNIVSQYPLSYFYLLNPHRINMGL